MNGQLPAVITLSAESSVDSRYDNHPVAAINDHVIRIATMTESYYWHVHPNSDETFLVLEGRLAVDFESGSLELDPGQLMTIPRGVCHRTRPVSARSVNLTFRTGRDGNSRSLITAQFPRGQEILSIAGVQSRRPRAGLPPTTSARQAARS